MKGTCKSYRKIFSQENIDRTLSGGLRAQIYLLGVTILLVLAIASVTVTLLHLALSTDDSWSEQMWVVYNNFVDSGNQYNQVEWPNRIAVVTISLLGSVLMGGILISTISNIIERRVDKVRSGRVRYKGIHNHYVIIGFSDITANLIKELYQDMLATNSLCPIIVMSNKECEWVRHQLQMQLTKEEEQQLYIYFGNIESQEELEGLNINKAKEVYILSEAKDNGRDAKNIQCVHLINLLRGNGNNRKLLPIYTQFDEPASYSVMQKLQLPKEYFCKKQELNAKITPHYNIYFRPFNFHENWARKLWSIYTLDGETYDPLDYVPVQVGADGQEKEWKQVHLVIVGFGRMGQALLLEALRVCHYAYYDEDKPETERIRTRITVIDHEMSSLRQKFLSFYPHLREQVQDISIDFREDDLFSEDVRSDMCKWCRSDDQQMTIAVCISDPDLSFQMGLNLPSDVYRSETRVLIRQEIRTDLGKIIHDDTERFHHVKVFGMLDQGVSKHILRDELSCYVNEDYKQNSFIKNLYAASINDMELYEKMKAQAKAGWIQLDENMRWANRYQLDAYLTYIRTLGLDVERSEGSSDAAVSPEEFNKMLTNSTKKALMRMEKYRWNAERTIEGWEYGKIKDNRHRVHPLIVPANQLPEKELMKDISVIWNLPYLLSLDGYKIVRK